MSKPTRIPTAEEFARASRLMKERARGLDEVRDRVLALFRERCPLHEFFILDQGDVDFRAYVFFMKNDDVDTCARSGISDEIVDQVYRELVRVGRGGRGQIKVAFEFDSDENVKASFEGDYFLRLR